ncbi:ABC transporter substrate-binding protein [Acidobacteriota bacterium]
MLRIPRKLIFLAPLIFLSLSACNDEKEIRIGVLLPQSGNAASYGPAILDGIRLGSEEINAKGIEGFDGYRIVLVVKDTRSDPQTARQAMLDLCDSSKDNCLAVIGPVSSSAAHAVAPIAVKRKRVLITPAASEPSLTKKGNFVFRICPSDLVEARKMADFAGKKLEIKRVAVMAESEDYGQGLKKAFAKSFKKRKGEICKIVNVPEGVEDLSTYVEEIKASKPDAVYITGYGATLIRYLKEIRKHEVQDRKGNASYLLSCSTLGSPVVCSDGCTEAAGVIFPQVEFDCTAESPIIQHYCERFRTAYGREPDALSAYGYDALNLLAHSIEVLGGPYPEDLPMIIATTNNWRGVMGHVTFDGNGDVISRYPKMFAYRQCRPVLFDIIYNEKKKALQAKRDRLLKEIKALEQKQAGG